MVIDSVDFVRDRRRMLKLFRQIVEGVSYFHSKCVIHRDLKVRKAYKYFATYRYFEFYFYLQPDNNSWIVMIALRLVILAWHDHSWIRQK